MSGLAQSEMSSRLAHLVFYAYSQCSRAWQAVCGSFPDSSPACVPCMSVSQSRSWEGDPDCKGLDSSSVLSMKLLTLVAIACCKVCLVNSW